MIISRTPYRVSFFGGGTDYPVWYREHPGAVLATSIDRYCYINCRRLPPFHEHKHRIVWSQIELVQELDKVLHPSVRETTRFMGADNGLAILHDGDLPASTGMGTSSSFTVGLLHALHALKGNMPSKMQLAKEAIYVEQQLIKENVGSQDQVTAAIGGFNAVHFEGQGITVTPMTLTPERIQELCGQLALFFTGFSRHASKVAAEQIRVTPERKNELRQMYTMVSQAVKILNDSSDLGDFGRLLHESWQLKRSLTTEITTSGIDDIYSAGIKAGAVGGKLLGAGGGGFMLFFVPWDKRENLRKALEELLYVPFNFENGGSQIIFYQP